ncbi:PREDICTED: DNA repair protein complementing XP-C cells homolog [Ceratosolen solmsi marchali]|uniref:DNA repair protein complementing XP-C cells homolog n=1 Tax=Ceratosolen solmsi marchali TaxID=326594 RepID=A0AAJ6YKU9_9HYME|nr:PREDICTED: DNA repair protein complementing XP-C cells homolog [Ceratosolen solmsi marchali]
MSQLSDDESSDSSNEFLIPADQIDLDSSFFKQSVTNSNLNKNTIVEESSEDSDDSDEFDFTNDKTIDYLSHILKNLENTKNQTHEDVANQLEPSTSKINNQESTDCKKDLANEITNLLLQGESKVTLSNQNDDAEDSKTETKEIYTIPQKGVQIHLPGENFLFDKKRKKEEDLQKLLQNKFNQRIRSSQILIHKSGLLCWLSHGFFLNGLANDPELLKTTLSEVSSHNYPKNRPDLMYVEKFTKWFAGIFQICEKYKEVTYTKNLLLQRISEKKIYNYKELILLYIATIRGMGINCRLVISLQPPPLKPKPEQLFKFTIVEDNKPNAKLIKQEKTVDKINEKISTTKKIIPNTNVRKSRSDKILHKSEERLTSPKKMIPENSSEATRIMNLKTRKQAAITLKKKAPTKNKLKKDDHLKDIKIENNSSKDTDSIQDECNLTIAEKLSLSISKSKKQDITNTSISNNQRQTRSKSKDIKSLENIKCRSSLNENLSDESNEFSTDDDYIETKPKKRVLTRANEKPKKRPANRINEKQTISSKLAGKENKNRKLLSSDEDDNTVNKTRYNIWVEVYVESEESWISVNVLDKQIHCASEIYKKADHPVLYIVAWNSDGTLKDVTRRYCPHWLTDTRKKRVDEKWWSETLLNWKERKTVMSKTEDEQLLQRELEQPLPKTVTECKGHPLYALTRHLLKFEALYPPDAVPLGHLKTGDAIYSRHCVHTLYSRETWIKRARVVKPAQEAYKIVKSMPKYDKLSGMKIKDQPLELFGKWQTTPYIPPEAKDGKVPRNEYGNVDLFKKCMLPKGTVHINLPALNRIARKLNIDCASACVGFNFGCRGAVPAFEGFVVCEEYEDTLREAWEEEQIEAQKRAQAKRDKRIYGNWKKLIKSLIIRERLATKYNFGGEEDEVENQDKEKVKTKAIKVVKTSKRGKQDNNSRKKVKHNSK